MYKEKKFFCLEGGVAKLLRTFGI